MSHSNTPLLEVRGIEAGYGASQVLFGVSLTIEPHQVVSLMGRNGMGKSTTIKCITGALPVRKGQILFEGRDITNLPADVIARLGIAIVPEGRQCFPNLTVREHLVAFARPPAQPQKEELAAQATPWDWPKSMHCSRASRSVSTIWATSFPVASSRCWRLGGHYRPIPSF